MEASAGRLRPGPGARRLTLGIAASLLIFASLVASASAAPSVALVVPQSTAFSVLGHSCGGIQEQAFATGFDPASRYPIGDVYLTTTCSTGGRGSHPATFSAWEAVSWDFAGKMPSSTTLTSAPTGLDPSLTATNALGVTVYNAGSRAYLTVPVPAPPAAVRAYQVGDQFRVSWLQNATSSAVNTSSTITATPIGSTAPVLTATVLGSGRIGYVGPLQPLTTYQITVMSTDAGGSSAASGPISASSVAASVPPSAPTGVSAYWTNPGNPGDMIAVNWNAAAPGNSPVDGYEITATVYEDTGPGVSLTVSGSALSAAAAADDGFPYSVVVRAHNAAGWGRWSSPTILGGA